MTKAPPTTIRLHGFEKTWSQSYTIESYRFHLSLLHSREALYMQGLLTLDSGLYLDEKATLQVYDDENQLLGEAGFTDLGRFTLLVSWTKDYLLNLKVGKNIYLIDRLSII